MYSEYFRLGGFMMWPLLLCSVLFVTVAIERTWTLLIKHKLFRRKLKHENHQQQTSVFEFFKDIPPAIGLLGTVIGVVQSVLQQWRDWQFRFVPRWRITFLNGF